MHLPPLILDLAVILAVAGLVTFLFKKIKQPVVLGYIIAGLIVGPNTPPYPLVTDINAIQTWAELGVIFLMFSLGLEFSFRKLLKAGFSATITAIFEVLMMMLTGFVLGRLFRWSFNDSLFLGAMLSISSTTVILKALEEFGLKTRRFAQLIFGILIFEDLAAILILVCLATFTKSHDFSFSTFVYSTGKLILVIGGWVVLGYFLVPRWVSRIGKAGSDEMLVVTSLGLCLGLVAMASSFQYSPALGAFIMGSILAETPESERIEELIRPLRDLFVAIFFVSVGMLINLGSIWQLKWQVAIILGTLTVGKIVWPTIGALVTGQPLKTSLQAGMGLAQIGEFSFIIAGLGVSLKATHQPLYAIAVAVSLLSTFATPYFIRVSHKCVRVLEKMLPYKTHLFLARYAAWSDRQRFQANNNDRITAYVLRWFISGIVTTIIWVLIAKLDLYNLFYDAVPNTLKSSFFKNIFVDTSWVGWAVKCVLALVLSSPFIIAMFLMPKKADNKSTSSPVELMSQPIPAVLMILRMGTIIWMSALSLVFIRGIYVGLFSLIGVGVLVFRFFPKVEASYEWFEAQFLSTFKPGQKKTRSPSKELRRLAPWSAHLVKIRVHPESEVVGKTIRELELRKRLGINIVAIQRGQRSLVTPDPDQTLFPRDELLVLGTDDQVDSAKREIEKPIHPVTAVQQKMVPLSDYELRSVLITKDSPINGKSIRTIGVREKFGAMVVGIERNMQRIMNPESDSAIKENDVLWLVGQSDRLKKLVDTISETTSKK